MAQRTLTLHEHLPQNGGQEVYDSFIGVEIQATEGYDSQTFTPLGGFFSLSGAGVADCEIGDDSGLHTEVDFPQGDPGYYVHVIRQPGAAAVDLTITLTYDVAG